MTLRLENKLFKRFPREPFGNAGTVLSCGVSGSSGQTAFFAPLRYAKQRVSPWEARERQRFSLRSATSQDIGSSLVLSSFPRRKNVTPSLRIPTRERVNEKIAPSLPNLVPRHRVVNGHALAGRSICWVPFSPGRCPGL